MATENDVINSEVRIAKEVYGNLVRDVQGLSEKFAECSLTVKRLEMILASDGSRSEMVNLHSEAEEQLRHLQIALKKAQRAVNTWRHDR